MYKIYEHLYLCKFSEVNEELLITFEITQIINLSQLTLNLNIDIFNINISDEEDSKISLFFNKTNKIITNTFIKGGKTLVCCLGCISRSPTIVLAFMIRKRKISLENGLMFLRRLSKNKISPNEGFLEQLRSYENQQSNTVS